MGNRNITLPVATAIAGAKTAGTNFLASDYVPDISKFYGQVVTVHIGNGLTNAGIFYYIINGVRQAFLNGAELAVEAGLERQITLRFGDTLNFQASADIDLKFLYLDLV